MAACIPDPTHDEPLAGIDAYCDTAPRATARPEEHGSFVLFVADRGWPVCTRPRRARNTGPMSDEIRTVQGCQLELGVPRHSSGFMRRRRHWPQRHGGLPSRVPLLVLGYLNAANNVAFDTPGTAVGEAGAAIRDNTLNAPEATLQLGFTVYALRSGRGAGRGFVQRAELLDVAATTLEVRSAASPRRDVAGVRPSRTGQIRTRTLAYHRLDNPAILVSCGAEGNEVAWAVRPMGRVCGTAWVAKIADGMPRAGSGNNINHQSNSTGQEGPRPLPCTPQERGRHRIRQAESSMTPGETVMELNRRDVLKGAAAAAGSLTILTGAGNASAATHPTLQVGSHWSQVLALQARLTSLGSWLGGVDGQFGDLTRQAVATIQKVAGLSRDGTCGPLTWSRVDAGVRPSA